MPETYIGRKFKTIFVQRQKLSPTLAIQKIRSWGRIFFQAGLAPVQGQARSGNISVRTPKGFIISAGGADLGHLTLSDFTWVLHVNTQRKKVWVQGLQEPSSETFLHALIYRQRPDVRAILHGHFTSPVGFKSPFLFPSPFPITRRTYSYGTLSLAREVVRVLKHHTFVLIRKHGFLSLGTTLDKAGAQALQIVLKKKGPKLQ